MGYSFVKHELQTKFLLKCFSEGGALHSLMKGGQKGGGLINKVLKTRDYKLLQYACNDILYISMLLIIFLLPVHSFAQDYTIRERDVLKITVYEHPDLSLNVRVSSDGTISFPLIGNIKVSGFTEKDVQEKIRSLLADGFIVNPQVSVIVEEYKDFFYVTGEVKKPGAYQYEEGMNVLKAVTLAGGFTDKASKRRIKIMRMEQNRNGTAPADFSTDTSNSENHNNNAVEIKVKLEDHVEPNDIIIVPESFF